MERSQKGVIAGLAGALGCALLVIAFLLGRGTTSRPEEVRVPAPVAPTSAARSSALESQTVPVEPTAGAVAAETPWLSVAPAPDLQLPVPSTSSVTVPAPERPISAPTGVAHREVAAYFSIIDRIEDIGAGDPQAFATSLMQSVSSGDFSGFDDLLTKARLQRERIRALNAPPACVDHHRLALSLSNDSVAMLERLRAALTKGDTTALLSMTTEGQTLEAQANQLKKMGEAIKRQAGL